MPLRDRTVELVRVPACQLVPHPKRWRTHPPRQRSLIAAMLDDLGAADALLARRTPDGQLELIDGHLRAELAGSELIPVLVLDLDERESDRLLAALDPLASLAEADSRALETLLDELHLPEGELEAILRSLIEPNEGHANPAGPQSASGSEPPLAEVFQIVVDCRDEAHQRELYQRFVSGGLKCRLVVL